MKIAIAGKGGSGKTTIAGTLARALGRSGDRGVLAIDVDSNPNLGMTLGLRRDELARIRPLDRSIVKRLSDASGAANVVLTRPAEEIVREYGTATRDGVVLLLMGRVEHAGAG